jgi:hypothetical protein
MAETKRDAIAVSTQPLNVAEIVQEVLRTERECLEELRAALLAEASRIEPLGRGFPRAV